MTIEQRVIVKQLIEDARALAEAYCRGTGHPYNDLKIVDAANRAETMLLQSQERRTDA